MGILCNPSLHNYYMEPWVSDPTDNIAVSASKTLALLALPICDAPRMTALMRMNFIIRKWLHITSVCLLIQLQLLMLRLYNWNHLCAYVVSGEWQTWWQLCIYNLKQQSMPFGVASASYLIAVQVSEHTNFSLQLVIPMLPTLALTVISLSFVHFISPHPSFLWSSCLLHIVMAIMSEK